MLPPTYSPEWSEETKHVYQHDMREMWDRSIAPHVWNQYHAQLDLYIRLAKKLAPRTILDVGCAQGTLALLLAESGFDVLANDLRKDFLDYAKSRYETGNIEFIQGNIFELNIDRKFDLIFANQIIEHLVYPADFLRQLGGLLAEQGHIIVTTPNHRYLKNNLPTYAGIGDPAHHIDRQFTADADGHFFAYTAEELCSFAKLAGFNSVAPFYFETPWISGHMKIRYLHKLFPVRLLKCLDHITRSIPVLERRACHQLGIVAAFGN